MMGSISIVLFAAAIYAVLNIENQWLGSARTYLVSTSKYLFDSKTSITNTTSEDWNLLYHLGGDGPWVPKLDGSGDNLEVPEGCRIDQVHMLARHNERYPTPRTAIRMVRLVNRLETSTTDFKDSPLSFFTNWTFFMHPEYLSQAGQLTTTGPYAGNLGAFKSGTELRTRYPTLHSEALSSNKTTKFWAADSPRVIDTAKHFASAFFGLDWETSGLADLNIIPETADLGADTLTSGVTCSNYVQDSLHGRDYGYQKLREWQNVYLPRMISRLETAIPGLNLSIDEAYTMQEICGFETLVRGHSPWCDIFNHEEWEQFEYARDVLHYYRSGPGNKYSAARAWPFLNATTNVLKQGPSAGRLFFSFVHDGDILSFLTSLSLFAQEKHLPTTHMPLSHAFKTSTLVPMGSRVNLELISCPVIYCSSNAPLYPNHVYCREDPVDDYYVRVVVNDAVVRMEGCGGETRGGACGIEEWARRVMLRGWEVGGFEGVCGSDGGRGEVRFLHQ